MKKNILFVLSILLFGLTSCEPDKAEPEMPPGKTKVRQDFERLIAKDDIAKLDGWLNIMVIDSVYTQPFLCWQGAEDGCNMVAQASAHLFDNTNAGILYESWLISPPLDLDNTTNKKLSFRTYANYWKDTDSLNVFYMRDLSAIDSKENPPVPLSVNIPKALGDANKWFTTNLDFDAIRGTILIGFRYRARGGNGNSTSYSLDDFTYGDVSALPNTTIFEETFASSLGQFTQKSVVGAQTWQWNDNVTFAPYALCAKISGYASNTNNPNEDWLISPSIDLSSVSTAILTFEHCINKGVATPEIIMNQQTVWISTNCTDVNNFSAATWEQIEILAYPTGTSWSFACSGKNSLDKYLGNNNVRIAFKYLSTVESCANWAIKNFKISK